MFCARPSAEVVAALRDQLEREARTEAVNIGNVLAEQCEERRADIEGQSVCLIGSPP